MTNSYISKLDQYHHEHLTWERMLDFFKQENAFLKTRLSQVLDRKIDKEFLALAEQFQNQFIIKDDFIDELKHDINEMETAVKESSGLMKIVPDIKVETKHNKLRNEMEYLEKNFAQLKNEFNKYLVSVL
jgi:L-lactate utilization protein LutC